MKTYLLNRWDTVRDSFWFFPAIVSLAMVGVAFVCITLDRAVAVRLAQHVPWIAVSPDAARATLAAIAGAMVSVAGIVFSAMLVTLSVTSSQYGSRLLRTFLADRMTQSTLGILVGTSLFSMIAIAGVHDAVNRQQHANVSVIAGVVFAVFSLAILVTFIHHVSNSLQAPNVVASVARDLDASLERLFPEESDDSGCPQAEVGDLDCNSAPAWIQESAEHEVRSRKEGYIQALDIDSVVSLAARANLFVELLIKPGQFVEREQPLCRFWFRHEPRNDDSEGDSNQGQDGSELLEFLKDDPLDAIAETVNGTIVVGVRRVPRQDAECALEELVEIAVRALSPGINDPFTAMACLDRISASLGRMATRQFPRSLRCDEEEGARVLVKTTTFANLLDTGLNQIRQHGCHCVAVAIHMLGSLRSITEHVQNDLQYEALMRHASMIEREFRRHIKEREDGDDFQLRFHELVKLLRGHQNRDE